MSDPIFHFIVVVDVEGFGRRTIPVQESTRSAMYEVIRNAFDDVRLDWDSVVRLDRGDGIVMLVPTCANSVLLAGRFVDALNEGLREKTRMFSAEHEIRLRVALHQGNCHQDANGWVGEAINTACRLVDAPELRDVLKAATTSTMAFIVSNEIYQGVIRHGYRHIDPAAFAPVALDIKEVHERAWIQVPGYSFPPGVPAPGSTPPPLSAPPTPLAARTGTSAPEPRSGGFIFYDKVTVKGDQVAGSKIVHGGRE